MWILVSVLLGCRPETPPDETPAATARFVTLNLLHGMFCQPDNCRLEERVDLLFRWLEEADCPDAVALQEIIDTSAALLEAHDTCGYELVAADEEWGLDDEAVLTRHPADMVEEMALYLGFRHVLRVRLDAPGGTVDLFVSHLASSSDGGPNPCGDDCPEECLDAGAESVRDCQAVQMASWVERDGDAEAVLATGDMNDPPGSATYERFVDVGLADAYLEAGAPECDPGTGIGCTSGRDDEGLSDLEDPELGVNERIDFLFGRGGEVVSAGTFADAPSSADCGPTPAPICWPSDHAGVVADYRR